MRGILVKYLRTHRGIHFQYQQLLAMGIYNPSYIVIPRYRPKNFVEKCENDMRYRFGIRRFSILATLEMTISKRVKFPSSAYV